MKRGVAKIAADFERESGNKVMVEFATAPEIHRRIAAGEAADVIVTHPAAMDEFQKSGKIVADSRGFVGRSRMGVVVHATAAAPALGDTAAFKRALLGASAVVHNKASSGIYASKLLEKLGLKDAIEPKIVIVETGSAIMEYVAAHPPSAIGLAQISEVMVMVDKGCAVKLAAPLPDAIQNVTSYHAAATPSSRAPAAARKLAASLSSDAAKTVFAATGIH